MKKNLILLLCSIAVLLFVGCAVHTGPSAGGDIIQPGGKKAGGDIIESGGNKAGGDIIEPSGNKVGGDVIK